MIHNGILASCAEICILERFAPSNQEDHRSLNRDTFPTLCLIIDLHLFNRDVFSREKIDIQKTISSYYTILLIFMRIIFVMNLVA